MYRRRLITTQSLGFRKVAKLARLESMPLPSFGHQILATTGSLLIRHDSISATPRSVADFEETELAEHVRDKEAWDPAEAVRSKALGATGMMSSGF